MSCSKPACITFIIICRILFLALASKSVKYPFSLYGLYKSKIHMDKQTEITEFHR